MSELETFRGRIYHVPDPNPVTQLQCSWCHKIADDTEPGMSRESVRALRVRMAARGWHVANPSDEDDAKTWRDSSDYCSDACARGEGQSAMEIEREKSISDRLLALGIGHRPGSNDKRELFRVQDGEVLGRFTAQEAIDKYLRGAA
jgi:hypothetical protein